MKKVDENNKKDDNQSEDNKDTKKLTQGVKESNEKTNVLLEKLIDKPIPKNILGVIGVIGKTLQSQLKSTEAQLKQTKESEEDEKRKEQTKEPTDANLLSRLGSLRDKVKNPFDKVKEKGSEIKNGMNLKNIIKLVVAGFGTSLALGFINGLTGGGVDKVIEFFKNTDWAGIKEKIGEFTGPLGLGALVVGIGSLISPFRTLRLALTALTGLKFMGKLAAGKIRNMGDLFPDKNDKKKKPGRSRSGKKQSQLKRRPPGAVDANGKKIGGQLYNPEKEPGFKKRTRIPKAIKGAGALGAILGIADVAMIRTDDTLSDKQKTRLTSESVGGSGGALAGAAAGAAIGSIIPVIGTAIGGLIGGSLGYFGGAAIGDKVGEIITSDKKEKPADLRSLGLDELEKKRNKLIDEKLKAQSDNQINQINGLPEDDANIKRLNKQIAAIESIQYQKRSGIVPTKNVQNDGDVQLANKGNQTNAGLSVNVSKDISKQKKVIDAANSSGGSIKNVIINNNNISPVNASKVYNNSRSENNVANVNGSGGSGGYAFSSVIGSNF